MKKQYIFILFFVTHLILGQTPTGNSDQVGITEGQLSVSLSGGANYSIPIAVPPGINGVVPQVGLVYNSQGGNGVAGYGWNISGVSAITRIPRTKFHDGVVGGVNLDTNDRFALDGQRLILKSGTYGIAGATYETENFSNIKITTYGITQNPTRFYFKVFYPDGSSAIYDAENPGTTLNYLIKSWTNAQNLTIMYSYIYDANNSYIDKIQYGSITTGTPINTIQFNYTNRSRPEQYYIGGISFSLSKILSSINVIGNSVGFRNYILEPEETTLGYTRLKSITEKSGDNLKTYNPTVFSYKEPVIAEETTFINSIDLSSNSGYVTTSGDFNGDGNLDFIQSGNKLYTNLNAGGSQPLQFNFIVPETENIFTFKSLEHDGKIMNRDAFCGKNYVLRTPDDGTFKGIKYNIYSIESNAVKTEYSKEFVFPMQNYIFYNYQSYEGDFNGDGLTDSMLFPITVNETETFHKLFYLNLDRSIVNDFSKASDFNIKDGQLFNTSTNSTFLKNAIVKPADVNGDGKTDLVVFRGFPTNKITVYSLDDNNNIAILFETNYDFKKKDGIVSSNGYAAIDDNNLINGDLNGDGKMDFVFPGIDRVVFLSTGKSFIIEALPSNIPTSTANSNFISGDYNNDGKTDMISVLNTTAVTPYALTLNFYSRLSSGNWTLRQSQYSSIMRNSTDDFYPIMIKPSKNFNDKPELLLLHKNNNGTTKLHYFINQNHLSNQKLVDNITTGNGVKETITYAPLINGNGVYTASGQIENYPNIDIVNASGFQVVSKIEKQSSLVYKKQLFTYYGAVSNTEGLSFLGFRSTVRTNWHDDTNAIISSISKFDIEQRGANVENYTVLGWHDPLTSTGKQKPNKIVKEGAYTITGSENLVATQSIVLKPNSWIQTGSTFTAKINPNVNVSPNTPTDYITKSLIDYESEL